MIDDKSISMIDKLIICVMNILFLGGIYALFTVELRVEKNKIVHCGVGFLPRVKELYWHDIEKIEGAYIVSFALLRLIPYSSSDKKILDIPIELYPKKAMAEILNHAPKDCQFHFDRYMQKYVDKVKKEMQQHSASNS
ncbi:MAG: hypothetical protein HQL26_09525 [Candidatus Omnitrophica bacterium]|nr:hypothetical protein [Candidatus Omnitrophota bacterium]